MRNLLRTLPFIFLLLNSACSTTHDVGNGKYLRVATAEERSSCGVNVNYSWLQECDGVIDPKEFGISYRNCTSVTPPQLASSQGVCGQIISGALSGAMTLGGFGLLSTVGNSLNATSNSTVVNQSVPAASHSGGSGHH